MHRTINFHGFLRKKCCIMAANLLQKIINFIKFCNIDVFFFNEMCNLMLQLYLNAQFFMNSLSLFTIKQKLF